MASRNRSGNGRAGRVTMADLLPQLLESLYAAPGTLSGWHSFLEVLRSATDASGAQLLTHYPQNRESSLAANAGGDPAGLALYQAYWCAHDPWVYSAQLSPPSGSVVNGEALVPHERLIRTAFLADFGRHYDIVRMVGATLETGPAGMSVLSISGGERRASFGTSETSLLEALVPHLQQALRLHRRLIGAEGEKDDLASVLHRLSRAIFLVDRTGRILFMNDAAARIVEQRDGLFIEGSELHTSSAQATSDLRRLIAGAIATSSGQGVDPGGLLSIGRASGRRPFIVMISPMPRRQVTAPMAEPAAALISVTDLDATRPPDEEILRHAFGLTPAEARLTQLLADGLSLTDASARLGLSRESARSRLKYIFEKTGTHRQAELVRLVLHGTRPE